MPKLKLWTPAVFLESKALALDILESKALALDILESKALALDKLMRRK